MQEGPYRALKAVADNHPPCSFNGLAAAAGVAPDEMGGLLDELAAGGYVEHTHLGWDLTERGLTEL